MLQSNSLLHLSSSLLQQDLTQVALFNLVTKQKTPSYQLHTILCKEQDNTFVQNTAQQKKEDTNTPFMQIHNMLYFDTNSLLFFFLFLPGHLVSF